MTTQTPDAVREAVDKAEAFAKSLHTTPEEHDWIMAAVRLARSALDSRAGDAGEVTLLRTALHEIDQIAGTTIPTDGNAAAWSALEAIIRLIHPFRTNGAYPPRTTPAPAVDAVPAGEVLRTICEKFRTDQAQGYRSADRTYVLEMARLAGITDPASLSHGEGRK